MKKIVAAALLAVTALMPAASQAKVPDPGDVIEWAKKIPYGVMTAACEIEFPKLCVYRTTGQEFGGSR